MTDKSPLPDRTEQILAELMREASLDEQEVIADLIFEGERIIYEASEGGSISDDYNTPALDKIIARIRDLSGIELDHSYFAIIHGGDSREDARFFAAPKSTPVSDLSDAEITALLQAATSEDNVAHYDKFQWFMEQSLGPAFTTDLIFWPYAEWSNAELVAEIRQRQAILAQSGADGLSEYELQIARALLVDSQAHPARKQWAESLLGASERAQTAN